MAPVWRPESVVGRHGDHGVEEQSGRADCLGQAGGVGLRQVALKGRRDHLLYWQGRKNERLSREGVTVGANDDATLLSDLLNERGDIFSGRLDDALARFRTTRRSGLARASRSLWRLPGRLLCRRHTPKTTGSYHDKG